jgi:hypothetical protein
MASRALMAYRDDTAGWSDGAAGHKFRIRITPRQLCGDRRFPGSHIACVLDDGHLERGELHESAEGDRWEDA